MKINKSKVRHQKWCNEIWIEWRNEVLLRKSKQPPNDHLPRNVAMLSKTYFSVRGNLLTPNFSSCVYVCSIYWQQNSVHIAKKIPRIRKEKRLSSSNIRCFELQVEGTRYLRCLQFFRNFSRVPEPLADILQPCTRTHALNSFVFCWRDRTGIYRVCNPYKVVSSI